MVVTIPAGTSAGHPISSRPELIALEHDLRSPDGGSAFNV